MQPAREASDLGDRLHLVFPASPAATRDNLAVMLGRPPLSRLTDDCRGTAELVLAEVLNNVAEHAYAGQSGSVAITLVRVQAGVACLVVDQGRPMPEGCLPSGSLPRVDVATDHLPEGGFGWHLIRRLTRDLTYQRAEGCNRLSFLLPCAL